MVAPTVKFCLPPGSSWPLADGELMKFSTTILSPAELVITTDVGRVMLYSAFGSPVTSYLAGVPEVFEFTVVPPVVVLEPSTSMVTLPEIELAEISPNTMPFCATRLMVDTIFASTAVVVVAAYAFFWLNEAIAAKSMIKTIISSCVLFACIVLTFITIVIR